MCMKSKSRQLRTRDYINNLAASGSYHFLSSDIRLPNPVRRYAATNAQAQGRNQFEEALFGVRIHSKAIQRHLSLV